MRSDMAKVIVERPRYGSRAHHDGKGYRKRWQRISLDDAPRRESIGARGGRTKGLNEHLGPLKRYLNKQVGRPWDKVFSEICQFIRLDSAVQSHVRDHLDDFVETCVIVIDGELCSGRPYRTGMPLGNYRQLMLYVCPRTGLLRRVKRRPH